MLFVCITVCLFDCANVLDGWIGQLFPTHDANTHMHMFTERIFQIVRCFDSAACVVGCIYKLASPFALIHLIYIHFYNEILATLNAGEPNTTTSDSSIECGSRA